MNKLKKLLETGIRDINKITEGKRFVDIYFHEDLDGVATAIGMKKYLENYGVELRECYTIQYGSEYQVKKPSGEPEVLTALVDFSSGKMGFTIHIDHHSGEHTGVDPETKTHFRKSPSNVETISGIISPSDVFPPADIKWINMIDSADFLKYGTKPGEMVVSQPVFTANVDENKKKMILAANRILLVYKNKNNLMTDTVKQAEPSILSIYQTVKRLSKDFPNIENIDKHAKEFQKGVASQKGIDYNEETGLLVIKMLSIGEKPGSYDRYAIFKSFPKSIMKIQQFAGMIQVAKNPFKKSNINIQGITNSVLNKYEKLIKPIRIGIAKIKGTSAHEETQEMMGFKYRDLIQLYGGKIQGLTPKDEPRVKELFDKTYPELTDEDKAYLNQNFTISVWDIIQNSSGGHPSIYNISGLSNITREVEAQTHVKEKMMNDLIKKFNVELLKQKQKLDEIFPISGNAPIEPKDSINTIQSGNKKIKLTPKMKNSIKKYKGYRFLIQESGFLSDDTSKLFMMLPDRDFVIGSIVYSIDSDMAFGRVRQTHYSSIHKNFRGKGLGKLLYEYYIKSFPIIASDFTLFGGSFHIWNNIDKYFGGFLYGYGANGLPILLTGLQKSKREEAIKKIENFVYIHKKSNLPKKLKIQEKIFSLVPNINDIVESEINEETFLNKLKYYNKNKGDTGSDYNVLDKIDGGSSGIYVVRHQNIDYVYVIKYDGNTKMKIKDILKSKLKNINKI